jgi:hypothetical protein
LQKPSLKRLVSYSNKKTKLVLLCVLVTLLLIIGYNQLIADTMDLQVSETDTIYFDQELKPLRIQPSKLPKQIKAIDFRVGAGEKSGGFGELARSYSIGIGTELKLDRKFDFHKIDMKIYHLKHFGIVVNEYALDWLSHIKLKRTNPYCFLFFGPSLTHLKSSYGERLGDSYSTISYIGINSGLGFNSIAFGSFLLGGKVQCHYLPLGKSAQFYKGEESYPQRLQLFDLVMQMEAGVVVTKYAIVKIIGEIRTHKMKHNNTNDEWSNWSEKEPMLSGGIEFRF